MTEKEIKEQENITDEEKAEKPEEAKETEGSDVEKAEKSSNQTETSGAGESTAQPVEVAVEDNTAHDDFDWTIDKKHVHQYSDDEINELESLYTGTLKSINENEIVKGTVVGITRSDVVLNIGFKSDGLVPISEFRDVEDLKVGDEVDVYVMEKEDLRGQLVLSRKNAKLLKAWEEIVNAHKNDTVVTGTISSKTKGGLIANVFGLETFLPGSQIDVKPIIDYDQYVGKQMEFKVVKINEAIKNAVVSHKALIESDLEDQRQEIISKLEKGQVLEGMVKNITDFGAFIDLGGVDGLLYITDISWGRINHPSEVLELNQKLNVAVLDFDDDKRRISLGLKQLMPHPWDTLEENLEIGSKVKGKIVNIEDYGAFLEIKPGVEGLIHVSEVTWSNQPINARDYFQLGSEHESIVMTIDREERKMALSLKRLTPDPWEKVKEKYAPETRHKGIVQNITPYGVFVELEEGIGGMVHISDLSWVKRYNHPSEFTKVGEELDVVVLEVDEESRKLSLGHKQIEEDPWDTFEGVFPVGSVHEATVLSREDGKGAIILLPYGLEAFAPMRHLKKEDGSNAEVDETLAFKVLEFNRNDKRILVSHTRSWEEGTKETKKAAPRKKSDGGRGTQKAGIKMEKTTLGDLGVLSELKEKMNQADDTPDVAEAKTEDKSIAETKDEAQTEAQEASNEETLEELKEEAKPETEVESKEGDAENNDDESAEKSESEEEKKDDSEK